MVGHYVLKPKASIHLYLIRVLIKDIDHKDRALKGGGPYSPQTVHVIYIVFF